MALLIRNLRRSDFEFRGGGIVSGIVKLLSPSSSCFVQCCLCLSFLESENVIDGRHMFLGSRVSTSVDVAVFVSSSQGIAL